MVAKPSPAEADPHYFAAANDFLNRAQRGDRTTLPALQEMMKNPALVDGFGGDLARRAQLCLIDKVAGQNLVLKEAVTGKLAQLRFDLSGPSPTPVERLLVECIVTCWLHLHYLETHYNCRDSLALELGTYFQRCLTAAQKRYLAAIRTLTVVRKRAVPVLQVNIARKQVNKAGTCVAASGEKAQANG